MTSLLYSRTKALTIACLAILFCFAAPLPRALAQEGYGYGEWQPRLHYKANSQWAPGAYPMDPQQYAQEASGQEQVGWSTAASNTLEWDGTTSTGVTFCAATLEVDVILEWVSMYGPSEPPANERESLPVKIHSHVEVNAAWDFGYSPSVELKADNGLDSPDTGEAPRTMKKTGARIVSASVTRDGDGVWRARAGSYKLSTSATVQPLAVNTGWGVQYIWEAAFANLYFTAQRDVRKVVLSRRGARGEVFDRDGNTHGHTIYSYYSKTKTDRGMIDVGWVTVPMVNWQEFDAALIGGWSQAWSADGDVVPNVDWVWDPAFSEATIDWNKWLVSFGNQKWVTDRWVGKTGPTSATMTYAATDRQDGATAIAKYFLTVHDPLEESVHNINRDVEMRRRPAGTPEIKNLSYKDSMTVPGGTVAKADTYGAGITFSGGSKEVSLWILETLGISVNFTYTVNVNATQQTESIVLPPRTYTYAMLYDTHERHWGYAERWDRDGFVGAEDFDFTIPRAPGWGLRMVKPIPLEESSGSSGGG